MAEEQGSRPTGQPPAPVRGESKAVSLSAQQLEALKDMKSSLSSIASTSKALVEGFNNLTSYLKESNVRLAAKATEDSREKKKGGDKTNTDELKVPSLNDFGKTIALALMSVATGFDAVIRAVKMIPFLLRKAFLPIKSIISYIDGGMAGLSKLFPKIVGAIETLYLKGLYFIDSFGKSIGSLGKRITGTINAALNSLSKVKLGLFDDFAKVFAAVGKSFMKGVGSIKRVGSFFDKVIDVLGFIPKLKPVLGALKNLTGPFGMVLFSIFDFIGGFIKGFNEGGIIEGLKQGGLEVIRGMITAPLDLLKGIVSWIADALGFENFSKALDSFSFTDLFDKYVVPAVDGIFNWIGNLFSIGSPAELAAAMGDVATLQLKIPVIIAEVVKNIVSWFASAFGFEGVSQVLDSFSFTDTFNKYVAPAVDEIFNWIGKIFTNPSEAMGDFSVFAAKLYAIPLDWIKNSVSWIASKLGFESFSEKLDSFSFSGLIDEYIAPAIRSIYDWIGSLFTNPVETISELATGIGNFATMIGTLIYDNVIKPITDWLKDLIPSWDDIKKMISDSLPSMTPNWIKEKLGLTAAEPAKAPDPQALANYEETLAKMAQEAQKRAGTSFQTSPIVVNNTTNQMGGGQSQTLGNIGVTTAAGPSGYKRYEHF